MTESISSINCPLPDHQGAEVITLAHGDGGRITRRFIERQLLPLLGNQTLRALGDAAHLTAEGPSIAFTTDSFVVSPLFFPGGDIGTLAVYGTTNDLVVSGAIPRWLSLSFIIEEGLRVSTLGRIVASIAAAAAHCQVQIVTGDTKVVPRGAVDKLFINTSGIGEVWTPRVPGPIGLQPDYEILVTGPIGRHGVAILASRENISFTVPPTSDCGSLIELATALREAQVPIVAMRDATRGGVSAVLHEWASHAKLSVVVNESALPLTADVRGACELLGLDPLHLANEGTMLVAVPSGWADRALSALRNVASGHRAVRIGQFVSPVQTPVMIRRMLGMLQAVDEPVSGALPRIC